MKDPYLKPVIFGGLFIALLTIVFALGLFLWAIVGGYVAVRIATKTTKEIMTFTDSVLIGLFTGIVGSVCIDLLMVISFSSVDNQKSLIRVLEKNWPKDVQPIPNLNEILPTVFITSSVLVIFIGIFFSVIGACIAMFITNKKNKKNVSV
jgi:MFS family permease